MTALDGRRRLWLLRATRLCGAAGAGLAAAVIVGWTFGWPALENLFVGLNPVHALLAIAMVLCGMALICSVPESRRPCRQISGLALAIALYTLIEYGLGKDLPVDRWLPQDLTLINPRLPGHMTLLSAIVLALIAKSLLALDVTWKARRPSNLFAGLAWGCSLLGAVNHLYGVNLLTGWLDMALPSALIFLILATGALTARPGLVANLFLDPGPGGEVARRFLPAAVIVPIFLGWLSVLVEGRFASAHTATATLVVCISAVFTVLVVRLATRIRETSRQLESARLHFDAAVAGVRDYAIFLLDV